VSGKKGSGKGGAIDNGLLDFRKLSIADIRKRIRPVSMTLRVKIESKFEYSELHDGFQTHLKNFDVSKPPTYPLNIVSLNSNKLGTLFNEFAAWSAFLRYALNIKDAGITAAEAELSDVKRVLGKELDVADTSLKPKERQALIEDHEVVAEHKKLLALYGVERQYLQAEYYYLDGCLKALSREFSRRGLMDPR